MVILFHFRNNDRENKPAGEYEIWFSSISVHGWWSWVWNRLGGPTIIPKCFWCAHHRHDSFSQCSNVFLSFTPLVNRKTRRKVVFQYHLIVIIFLFLGKKHILSFNIQISLGPSCTNESYTSCGYQAKQHKPWV